MDLTTFEAQIREIVNEGTSFDLAITGAVRKAARWIERNFDLPYMFQNALYSLAKGASSITLELIGGSIFMMPKSILSVQLSDGNKFLNDIEIIDRTDLNAAKMQEFSVAGPPKFATIQRNVTESITGSTPMLHLYPAADVAYNVTVYAIRYTDRWITTGSHWLLENAEDLMEALAVGYMAPIVRDPELIQFYAAIKAEAVKTLQIANTQLIVELEDMRGHYAGENLP